MYHSLGNTKLNYALVKIVQNQNKIHTNKVLNEKP